MGKDRVSECVGKDILDGLKSTVALGRTTPRRLEISLPTHCEARSLPTSCQGPKFLALSDRHHEGKLKLEILKISSSFEKVTFCDQNKRWCTKIEASQSHYEEGPEGVFCIITPISFHPLNLSTSRFVSVREEEGLLRDGVKPGGALIE